MGYFDPPEGPEPSPQSVEIWKILEEAGVRETTIEQVCEIVDKVVAETSRECPECEHQAAKAEAEADKEAAEARKEAAEYWASKCPHGRDEVIGCNPCLIAGDLAYDAERERRMFEK